jgi:Alpha/beta hydrolase
MSAGQLATNIVDLQQKLATVIAEANGVDAELTNALNMSTGKIPAPATPLPPSPALPPPDAKPDDVKKWWDSLNDEQRRAALRAHPGELGNFTGIPVEARNDANLTVMDHDLAVVEDAAGRSGVSTDDVIKDPGKYGLTDTDITRYQNAVQTNNGLIHDSGGGKYPTYLFAYDPTAFDGRGRAAISIGNPDKSPNTAVIVPGTSANVRGGWLSDGHDDALNLFERANQTDPTHPTAVMAWMGYQTPDNFGDPKIATPWLARFGASSLANDVNGLWLTHDGSPSVVTVLGHSYGSTTVADAFVEGMHANDAVLLGSPGTDLAHSAADFHVDGGHVYVGSASTDPVSVIGESGRLPDVLNRGLGSPLGALAGLGIDPAGDQYGSVRFHAEVPGSTGLDEHDHSHYYHQHSESLAAMADIVSGYGDALASQGLIAQGRHQPHLTTPDHVDLPFVGRVDVPHVDVPIPGTPAYVDPEWNRPPGSIQDNW